MRDTDIDTVIEKDVVLLNVVNAVLKLILNDNYF